MSTYDSAFHERETIEQFISMRCDNLILYSRYLSDEELIELAPHMPEFRLLDRYIEQLPNRCVYFNHTTAGHIATQYLIDQGHKVIGCIAGNTAYQNAHARYQGYKKALSLNNLPLDKALVFKGERYDSEQGYKGIHHLWQQRSDMTALYVCSEDMASGCLDATRELKITVPDDLAIISYDSHHLCNSLYPKLTTVDFPVCDMASLAIKQMIEPESVMAGITEFIPRIYERDSV